MPRPLTIALLQINPTGTLDGNLAKGILACRRAAELGADIALFPEMWSNGYALHGRPVEDWTAEAVDVDGDFVSAFGELARKLNMAIGVTLLERYEGGPRNTLVLFDRFGERQLTYAKVHTCDFDVERHLTPGASSRYACSTPPTAPARTGPGICACCRQTAPKACSSPSSIWISCGNTGNTRCRATPIGIRNSMGCYAAGRSTRRSSGRTDVSSPCRNAVRRPAGASPVRRFAQDSARHRQAPPAGTRLQVGCRIWQRTPKRSVVRRPPRCCRRVR